MLKKILLFSLIFLSSDVKAEDPTNEQERRIIYKSKTEIDFESVELQGALTKPQGSLVVERKQSSFNPLIKLRENFNQEIEQSTKEIR